MSLHRFFLTGDLPESATAGWAVPLSPKDLRHLGLVLRLTPGERVMFADPRGREAEGLLVDVSAEALVADMAAPTRPVARPRVALAQGLARRERMEFVVQKVTELGASELLPVAFARSVVKLDEEKAGKRTERWRRIAEEAAKQSQRAEVPLVREPVALHGLIEAAKGFDVVLVAWEESVGTPVPGIGEALDAAGATGHTSVLLVIGPEGGLESAEVEALERDAAAVRVGLGDTVLRTETAGVIAVAIASYELGGLGGRPRG
jgi:16S rRNA (uracil1498-N3)-methyltransferase